MRWRLEDSDPEERAIFFRLEVRRVTWVALGISPLGGMLGTDAVIGQPFNGVVAQFDLNARSVSGVSPDVRQSLLPGAAVEVIGGTTVMVFGRLLDTGDPTDTIIDPNLETKMVFAYGGEGLTRLSPHKTRGALSVSLNSGCGVPADSANLQRTKSVHGGLMVVGWCLCVFFGIMVARYFRDRAWWVMVHARLQSLGTAGTVSGAAFALSFGSTGMSSPHAAFGILIALCTTIQAYMGGTVHSWRSQRPIGTRDRVIDAIALVHIWLGKVLFLVALYNISLGIELIGFKDEFLQPYQYLVGWMLLWLFVMEVRLWRRRRIDSVRGKKGAHRRRMSSMFTTESGLGGPRAGAAGGAPPISKLDLEEVSKAHGVPIEYVHAAHNVTQLHEKKSELLVPLVLTTRVGLRNTQEVESLCQLLSKLHPIRGLCITDFPSLDPLLRDLVQSLVVIRVGMRGPGGSVRPGTAPTAVRVDSTTSRVARAPPSALTRKVSRAIGLVVSDTVVGDDAHSDSDSDAGPQLVSLAGTKLGIKPPLATIPGAPGRSEGRYNLCPFLVLQGRVSVAMVDRYHRELCRTTYEAGQGSFPSVPIRQEVVDVSSDAIALVVGYYEYKAMAERHVNYPTKLLTALLVYLDVNVGWLTGGMGMA